MIRPSTVLLAAAATLQLGLAGCAGLVDRDQARQPDAELLHTAVDQLSNVIIYDIMSPPQSSRVYAYSSIAAYETLRQEHPDYVTLAGQVNELATVPAPEAGAEYSFPLASYHAFMTVGRAMVFSRARLDSARTMVERQLRAGGISAPVYDRSIAYGDAVAKHILAWAGKDHYLQTRGMPKYAVTAAAGRWSPTPPAYMDAVEPHWGEIRPFVMDSSSQFRPAPPPPFDTMPSSAFYRQAKAVMDVGLQLTAEQRAIAAFWDCNPYVMHVQGHAMFATKKISPGGHWMGVTGIASRMSGADLMKTSAAYAQASIALADAFISAWDVKFRTETIRPETYINRYISERWMPLLQTPPFPEYTSAHSVASNSVAVILTREFGENFAFADSTELSFGLPVRSFPSFQAAANEAAISRFYGGIHYRPSVEAGSRQGTEVGRFVASRIHTQRAVAARPPATTATDASRH